MVPLCLRLATVEACAQAWHAQRAAVHAAEALRAAGIVRPQRRAQFQAGRWLAAQMLAEQFGGDNPDWCFSCEPGEKPRLLSGPAPTLEWPGLSLAHRGGWVCCAVAGGPVGVDLETSGPLAERPEASRDFVLAASEMAAHQSLAPALQGEDLLRRWVLKEAWSKHTGQGLGLGDMACLQVQAASPATANARSWQADGLWLAVCGARLVDTRLTGLPPNAVEGWWQVGPTGPTNV